MKTTEDHLLVVSGSGDGELQDCEENRLRQFRQGVSRCAHTYGEKGEHRYFFQCCSFLDALQRALCPSFFFLLCGMVFMSSRVLLQVALKVIDKDGAPSARKLVHKVRREIRNMRKLRHPSIVEIYESESPVLHAFAARV